MLTSGSSAGGGGGSPHPAALDDESLLRQCRWMRSRASGPGGQHRNKVETCVTILHTPTGLTARASERRSVAENRRRALHRLRLLLAVRLRSRVGEEPSAVWRSRCREGRIVCNPDHRDYPALLAEALDALEAAGWEPRGAALHLGCTPTQLLRLVREHPAAWTHLNQQRGARGLHTLS